MSASQWFMALSGRQVGPMPEQEVIAGLENGTADGNTLVFTAGMTNWAPISTVPQFVPYLKSGVPAPPPPSVPGATRQANEIDFKIYGEDMQFVEVELDPGESAVAEAGAMMYMTDGIAMETIFGDGSAQSKTGGIMGALLGAGRRVLTGESMFMTVFTNNGPGKHRVAFAAPYPGRILTLDLAGLGGSLICQKDSFLCAARGVSINIAFNKKIGVGLFGGEGFIMQRLDGDGICFANAGGMVHALDLGPGQTLRVDTGCLVALQPTVTYDIQFVGGVKTALFGGEGLFFATLRGPGKVWLQSLPLSRLADRLYKAAPQTGKRKEEGSVLDMVGGLGNLLDGDG